MKTHGFFGSLVAGAILALSVNASAVDLAYDDGTFESFQTPVAGSVDAVEFTLPTAEPYALDAVTVYLDAAAAGAYPFSVRIWDKALEPLATQPFPVVFGAAGWYTLDLTGAGVVVDGTFRIGVAPDDPAAGTLLGLDTTVPGGQSYVFDTVAATWTPNAAGNYGIRAAAHPVQGLTCQGFLAPVGKKPIVLRKGGRTLPLKARLLDAAGVPVPKAGLSAPPIVKVWYSATPDAEPVDVSASIAPAGRSNLGNAFRPTGGQRWMYNLKTSKFLAIGTYTIYLESGDEAGYLVEPTCSTSVQVVGPKQKKHGPKMQ